MVRCRPAVPLLLLPLLLLARVAGAATPATPTFDVSVAGSWRTSFDKSDRSPGFQALAGGGELFIGVSWGAIGFAAGARARGGAARDGSFIDVGGDLALQLLLGERVRLRLGAEGGRAFLGAAAADFAGGFLESVIDVAQLGGGRAAFAFNIRLDLDRYLDADAADPLFPDLSTSLAAGFGVRY